MENSGSGGEGGSTPPNANSGAFSEHFQHQPVAARVPEKLARGVMSTGVLVLDSPTEFVLDFLQGLTRPHQIVARVVVTAPVLEQVVHATRENLMRYRQAYPSAATPQVTPPPGPRPTIADIYETFKLPDDLLSGTYANSVLVGHSPAEFFFDFITGFYPTAAVSSRVIMSAPHVARMVDTLGSALQQYRQRMNIPSPPQPPLNPPAAPPTASPPGDPAGQ